MFEEQQRVARRQRLYTSWTAAARCGRGSEEISILGSWLLLLQLRSGRRYQAQRNQRLNKLGWNVAQLANSGVNDAVRTTTTTRVQSRRSPTLTACCFWQPRFRVWSCLRSPRSSSPGHRIDGHPPLRARSQRSLVRSVNPSSSRTPHRVTGGHGAAAAVARELMPNRTTCLGSRRAARRAGRRSLAQPDKASGRWTRSSRHSAWRRCRRLAQTRTWKDERWGEEEM